MKPVKVAIVGVGKISGIYLTNITTRYSGALSLAGVCDLIPERSRDAAQRYGGKIYPDVDALLADPEVEMVLNLTRPLEHFDISMKALAAGKHVYSEKPLAGNYGEGLQIFQAAKQRGLLIGCAPDTFLGAGIETCRDILTSDRIGRPVGVMAAMVSSGPEPWHPDPEFYYLPGGGPVMDMAPYYLTAMVRLLGPIRSVLGQAKASFPFRTVGSGPKQGKTFPVEVDTWVNALINFESGAAGTFTATFDGHYDKQARFEIYGEKSTLRAPDPNTFGGPVSILEEGAWKEAPLIEGRADDSRGLGVQGMAMAIRQGGDYAANGQLALHVLEAMEKILSSAKAGCLLELETRP